MEIMDDVIKYKKSLPKKDFSNYTSYEELKSDLDVILQKQKSKDVTKIYEDSDLLVIAANTWEASCKYGAGSKWCTTAKDTDNYWRRHNETGTEFFWIFKNVDPSDPRYKYSFHVKHSGGWDICDSVNNCGDEKSKVFKDSLIKKHPKFQEIVEKLIQINEPRKADSDKLRDERLGPYYVWVENNYEQIFNMLTKKVLKKEISNLIDDSTIDMIFNQIIDEEGYGYDVIDDELFGDEEFLYDVISKISKNFNVGSDLIDSQNLEDSIKWVIRDYLRFSNENNRLPQNNNQWLRFLSKSIDEDGGFYFDIVEVLNEVRQDISLEIYEEVIGYLVDEGIIESMY